MINFTKQSYQINYLKKTSCPKKLRYWLTLEGSLTAKLELLSGQKLIVKPQFEGRVLLSLAEKKQLGIYPHRQQSAWVREATLYGHEKTQAWVLARSVFPFCSLTGSRRKLTNLGKTPIGYVIFGRNKAILNKRWLEKTPIGWQRTSLYLWQGKPMLVSEVFLPAFEEFI